MDVLHPRCCGLDVHKSSISACILLREAGRVQKQQRRFGAMTQDLRELGEWLRQFGVTQVAMESSGVYWKPVWNILEREFTVVLANAQHIKNVPGRKTDQKDAEWIAQLLQYGLLRPSYVPCEIIRDLRDLTRMRASLSEEASRIISRIQKVLEDANVKLASVATNALGKSGRTMLENVITGEDDPEHLASLALGHLRVKIPQLRLALEGKIRPIIAFCFGVYWINCSLWNTRLHCSKNVWRRSADKDRSYRKRWLAGTRYQESIEWQPGPF
jgi:transposase